MVSRNPAPGSPDPRPEAAATGPHVLRRINVAEVLRALRESDGAVARVSDLVAATGLSRPAVTRALNALADGGVVAWLGTEPHQMGRPAVRVRFRAELGHVAGIDIGPHTMALAIADLAGTTRAEHRISTGTQATGPDLVGILRTELAALAARAGIAPAQLWAVAVGTPGIVDHERGEVALAPSIPGWTGLPMLTELRKWLDCPVLIDNDVNLAVLAETWRGEADGTLLYVHWGKRIGTGLIIDGKPYGGASSSAGELGFVDVATPIDRTPAPVKDGLGPFEQLVGAEAIRRLAVAACDRPLARALDATPSLAPLFDAAAGGDVAALAVVDQVTARFARGLATHLLLLDPGHVVIGGGLANGGDLLLQGLQRHLEPLVLSPFTLRVSTLRENAVIIGAVRRALDAAEQRLAALL